MASMQNASFTDKASRAAISLITYGTRTTTAVGVPAYVIYARLNSVPTLKSPPSKLAAASLIVLSTPSTLYCALGAIEGFIRAGGHLLKYPFMSNKVVERDHFEKECTTLIGLARGALSPISGYAIMASEWNKTPQDSGNPRLLKEEYYVYSVPRNIGRTLVEWGRWGLRLLQKGYEIGVEWTTRAVNFAWTQTVRFVQWSWRVSAPLRRLLWDIGAWTVDRIIDVWNLTEPLRHIIKVLVWDFALKTVVWNWAIKTLVWKWIIQTVIVDWIAVKFVWKFLIKIVFNNFIWKPVKWVWLNIVWPTLKFIYNVIAEIVYRAFQLISWATSLAFQLFNNKR